MPEAGRLYYYPEDSGTLEVIDLGAITELEDDQRLLGDAVTGDGGVMSRSWDAAFWSIRVVRAHFGTPGGSELERQLQTFTNHAQRGLPFGFSLNHAKSWCVKLSAGTTRGNTSATANQDNGFYQWNSSAGVTTGDELVVSCGSRVDKREFKLGGASGTAITFGSALDYTMASPVFVRWRDFYPVCYLTNPDEPVITSDRRRNWTLDMSLTFAEASLVRAFRPANLDINGRIKLSTTISAASLISLQDAVAR